MSERWFSETTNILDSMKSKPMNEVNRDEGQFIEQLVRYPHCFACVVLMVTERQPFDLSLFQCFLPATQLCDLFFWCPQSFTCEVLVVTETQPFRFVFAQLFRAAQFENQSGRGGSHSTPLRQAAGAVTVRPCDVGTCIRVNFARSARLGQRNASAVG